MQSFACDMLLLGVRNALMKRGLRLSDPARSDGIGRDALRHTAVQITMSTGNKAVESNRAREHAQFYRNYDSPYSIRVDDLTLTPDPRPPDHRQSSSI